MLASFLCGNLSYTSHVDFIFMWGVSVTHPVLLSFLCGEFVLHITCCLDFYAGNLWPPPPFFFFCAHPSDTSRAGFIFMGVVSLTHPMLASFLSGEFLLHIPCSIYISVGSLSYRSHAFLLLLFFCGVFFQSVAYLFYIPCSLH